jgi:hypothetical protein
MNLAETSIIAINKPRLNISHIRCVKTYIDIMIAPVSSVIILEKGCSVSLTKDKIVRNTKDRLVKRILIDLISAELFILFLVYNGSYLIS